MVKSHNVKFLSLDQQEELNRHFVFSKYDQKYLEQKTIAQCELYRVGYLDTPTLIHIETMAKCNAKCNFCPYTTMDRKDEKMSDELFEKIILDLTDIPLKNRFQINPYKVSEPFLEPRLFDMLDLIIEKLPNASIGFITNGSPLTEKKIQKLSFLDHIRFAPIKISLNTLDPTEYESIMKIPLNKTLKRLDILHKYIAKGILKIKIEITRVSNTPQSDLEFLTLVNQRYPLFNPYINRKNDWLGKINFSNKNQIPDAPCTRWFDLSITATGEVAKCCMDGNADYPKGDVNKQHVLDIYRQSKLEMLRLYLPNRKATEAPCNTCTYLN